MVYAADLDAAVLYLKFFTKSALSLHLVNHCYMNARKKQWANSTDSLREQVYLLGS